MTAFAKFPDDSSEANGALAISKAPLGQRPKRVFDVCFSLLALSASAIPFLFIAALLKLLSPGPLFFAHERVGFGGRRFKCVKFRTMVVDAEARLAEHLAADPQARKEFAEMRKLRNDPRIVPGIGHFLRKTSLDELPQFINVLRGDMSIVGPRPVTPPELEDYGLHKKTYLRTRPGITGLWQISGRSNVSFEERVRMDTEYVDSWSMGRDLSISLRTAGVFFDRNSAC